MNMRSQIGDRIHPVLVTGAGGFLGHEIVEQLRLAGTRLRVLGRGEIDDVEVVVGDVRDREASRRAVDGVRTVIHAAGKAHVFGHESDLIEEFLSINENGSRILAEEAVRAGVVHFIYLSSVSVYGSSGRVEGDICEPGSPYALSKLRGERAVLGVTRGTDTAVTILRLATVYGRGDRGNVARLGEAIRSERFFWISKGRNMKSLIHRTDAARACVEASAGVPVVPALFNVSAPPVQMREVVDTLADVLGKRRPRRGLPMLSLFVGLASGICTKRGRIGRIVQTAAKFIQDDVYPADRIAESLGFRCRMNLRSGLQEQFFVRRTGGTS